MRRPWDGFASNWPIWIASAKVSLKPGGWARPLLPWTGPVAYVCHCSYYKQMLQRMLGRFILVMLIDGYCGSSSERGASEVTELLD